MKIVLFILLYTLLVFIGVALVLKIRRSEPFTGTLKFDDSDPDGRYLFLEISESELRTLQLKKYVKLKVEDITQK